MWAWAPSLAQDLAALAVLAGAVAWLLTRWLRRDRECSGCAQRPRAQVHGTAAIRSRRLTVLR